MKKVLFAVLAILLLITCVSAPILADGGGPRPLCVPPEVCNK